MVHNLANATLNDQFGALIAREERLCSQDTHRESEREIHSQSDAICDSIPYDDTDTPSQPPSDDALSSHAHSCTPS